MKITIGEVSTAFAAMAADGRNTESTAQKKLSVIRSIAKKYLEHTGADASNAARDKLDLRNVFKGPFDARMDAWFPNKATRASNYGVVVSCIDAFGHGAFGLSDDAYQAIKRCMMSLRGDVTAARELNECPPERIVRFERLLEAEKALGESEYGSDAHLALAVCTLIPPRRGDLSTLQFVSADSYQAQPPEASDDRPEGNYCIISSDDVVLDIRKFKTAKAYGPFVISLENPDPRFAKFMEDPGKLAAILRHRYERVGNDFVFPAGNGYADRTQRYLQTLKEAIKRETGLFLGIQAVRRAHATYKDTKEWSVAELRDLAYLRGHSKETAETYKQICVVREKAAEEAMIADNSRQDAEVQCEAIDDGYLEIAGELLGDIGDQVSSIATALVPLAKREDTARMVLGWLVTLEDDLAKIRDVIGSRSVDALFSEVSHHA